MYSKVTAHFLSLELSSRVYFSRAFSPYPVLTLAICKRGEEGSKIGYL